MTFDAFLTLAVLAGALGLLARNRLAPALVVFGADVVLLVAGVVEPADAFSGFANPAPFTVAALYVVARAVEKTGGLRPLVDALLDSSGSGGEDGRADGAARSVRGALLRLLPGTAAASAFLNNTPIVAMLTPEVDAWARSRGRPSSRYLMPLSFAAILGGTITVIGTSTTIVVSGLLESYGSAPVGMFEIARLGLPVAVVGIGYLVVVAPVLIPDRRTAREEFEEKAREFTVYMKVDEDGPLEGVEVEAGGLRHLKHVFLARIDRPGEVIAPVEPTTVLRGGDRLTFVGRAGRIVDLHRMRGLSSAEWEHLAQFHDAGHTYFEAVVGSASPLVGTTLAEAGFRDRYDAAVLAVHRSGERIRAKLGEVRLRTGDTLLLLARTDFDERWRHRPDFLLIARLGGLAPTTTRQAWAVTGILGGIVGLAASGTLPILHASLLGAAGVLLAGILTPTEALRGIDVNVVVLIAAAFGLGRALEVTGLAEAAAGGITGAFGGFGTGGLVLGIVLATLVLTEVVTNNAAAVLVFPIALSVAGDAGLDPRPVILAVAIAASTSFLTPIGYQTNTMVYGPGGYRFSDYARLGFPLTILVVILLPVLVMGLYP